jgi:hypothetical protein
MLPLLSLTAALSLAQASPADDESFFELKIRPVLVDSCLKCHGGAKVSSGLRVDARANFLKGGERGPALVPGKANESLLLRVLRHTEGVPHMPPNKRLPDEVVADVAAWVERGAVWPNGRAVRAEASPASQHWAFRPVHAMSPPEDPYGLAQNPVDRFIAAGLRAHGLTPTPPADRPTLLRRVTFDLIGLPPTPEEVAAFVADHAPDAYERIVERLLAAPAYGERWGRHWMDVVRYADTAGDNADYPVPEARLYRDYIIAAFNADMPYDRFVREQLAGDLLARQQQGEAYAEPLIATTFLGLSRRYLTAPYEQWHLTLEDTIDTTGRAFLGLTLRCARCHDHKYDPVTQEDYYALYGIFASTQFPYAGSEEFASMKKPREHFQPLVPPGEASPRLAAAGKRMQSLEQESAHAEKQGARDRAARLRDELRVLHRANLPPDLPGAYAVSDGRPADVPVQKGGDPARPGSVVRRGVPRFLAGVHPFQIPDSESGRRQFAEWLTDPAHPLVARVMVNRIWQYHFGRGLVGTPSNFGLRGEPPTHPELLDWLAARFVAEGWSVKALHRLIVTSRTYQQSSTPAGSSAGKDPGNRWYGRFDRRRLDAEALRDGLLAVSGNLDLRRPGPHPFPPISAWGWTQHAPFKDVYPTDRRSVYLMIQRLQRHPYLAIFDGPDPNTSTDVRGSSTVPSQALYFMNNPFVAKQARGLAGRALRAGPGTASRLARACELAWNRLPTEQEMSAFSDYLNRYSAELARSGLPAGEREQEAWTSVARVLLSANEFVYLD